MRAWALEVSEDERHTRRFKTPTGLSRAVQSSHLTRALKSSDGNIRLIPSNIPTNRSCASKAPLRGRSRSRSADITPYDEHDRSRSRSVGCAFDDSDDHTGECRQGQLRAWLDEDSCPPVQKATIAITCEHVGGFVKCTNLAGNEVGEFEVPRKEDSYGTWLGSAISQAHQAGIGEVCLMKRDGTIFWREGLDKKATSMIKPTLARSNGRRFTGRERFMEGHDNRDGVCFAEYHTPRRRPYTHRDRWTEGHDDRDGWTYADHAPSVRPLLDSKRFSRQ